MITITIKEPGKVKVKFGPATGLGATVDEALNNVGVLLSFVQSRTESDKLSKEFCRLLGKEFTPETFVLKGE